MGRVKWPLAVVVACVLAAGGCSDSDGDSDPLDAIAQQVQVLLGFVTDVVTDLNPYPDPPAICEDASNGFCNEGGFLEQCPGGDVHFDNCAGSQPGVTFEIDGDLQYFASEPWPEGNRTLLLSSPAEGDATFELTFFTTGTVIVQATLAGVQAECTGALGQPATVEDCHLL